MQTQKQPVLREDRMLTTLFETEEGKQVLEYLESMFYNNSTFVRGDTNLTMYKIGQQDVIGFIRETMALVNQPRIEGVGNELI